MREMLRSVSKKAIKCISNNINEKYKHCQLTKKIPKYSLVTKSQNRRNSSLHVYAVFSRNQVR